MSVRSLWLTGKCWLKNKWRELMRIIGVTWVIFKMGQWIVKQIHKRVYCVPHYSRTTGGEIHRFFGLSYCSYYTVPRLALQEMPRWWQWCFVFLVNMLPETPEYTCQRRNRTGLFINNEPWARYRHGRVEDAIKLDRDHD